MKKQILLLIAIIVSLTSYGQDTKLIAKAESGNTRSQYSLAIYYKYGWHGFSKDEVKYIHWLKKAAEGGVSRSTTQVGMCSYRRVIQCATGR